MELYLMQHGSCLPKEIDPNQPLSPVGAEQVMKSAEAARRLGLGFDAIVTSPKPRARETATMVASAWDFPTGSIHVTEAVKAMAEPKDTLAYLQTLGPQEAIFVAGHLPNLGKLASFLLTSEQELNIAIENGGLLRLDAPQLAPGNATLRWYLTPMQLQIIAGS